MQVTEEAYGEAGIRSMVIREFPEKTIPLTRVRTTKVLRMLLGIQGIFVTGVSLGEGSLVLDVRPTKRKPRCSECGRRRATSGVGRERMWRHLDLGGIKTKLRYSIRQVKCPQCGVRVERVPWARPGSRFTLLFENQVAYLAQRCDTTTVAEQMRTTWRSVGRICMRVVESAGLLSPERLDGLTHIGIDELSYRKHHQYITVVTDHATGRVVWAGEGKSSESVAAFFSELGPERAKKIEYVTLDLSAAFAKGVRENAPNAKLVFDRFHVQRLVHRALDEVRRSLVRQADSPEQRAPLKKTRWPLQKNPCNLTTTEKGTLQRLRKQNEPLIRAYDLKEGLRIALEITVVPIAEHLLHEWINWAARSRLAPFVRAAKTIRKHLDGILEYIRTGLSNGPSEALNGKIRTITRRTFGLHSATSLIALLYLCCSGLLLYPSHYWVDFAH